MVGSRQVDGTTATAMGHKGGRHRGRANTQSTHGAAGYLDRVVESLGKIIIKLPLLLILILTQIKRYFR